MRQNAGAEDGYIREAELRSAALSVKKRMLSMANSCGQRTHLGGSLSMAELLTVLYMAVMDHDPSDPLWPDRDRFILSKGHCVLAFYAVLAECGYISGQLLDTFQRDGTALGAHPTMAPELGIESSNGSLGQGIGMAVGLAKAAKLKGQKHDVYVLIGNGECNEGAVWEAAMLAAQWKLDNLTAIIDDNDMQSDGSSAQIVHMDLKKIWESFGWEVREIDGHDVMAALEAYTAPRIDRPRVIIGRTVKGHGISFMENNGEWHHNRLTDKLYEQACQELEAEA